MPTEVVKAGYWSSTSGFPVASIESTHFTHLFCAFADLDCQTYEVAIPEETMPEFSTFTEIVQQLNPDVKTLLSIGGPSSIPSTFASMANQRINRALFIGSSIKLARTYNFHGLDLCWLYPSTEDESGDLGTLLNEWREAINAEANASGYEPLLLTAQVFYSPQPYQYPRHAIVRTLDWINVMAYDFHSPNNSPDHTRAHAAWRSNEEDQPSGETGINAWLETVGNRTKMIVLGLPFFGYAWSLVDENNNQVYAPAKGAPASYSNPTGFMGYDKINHFEATERKFDPDTKTNYCYDATTWISYDDTEAIAKKIRKAKEKELLGYFAWHVGTDDNWILSKTAAQEWGEL